GPGEDRRGRERPGGHPADHRRDHRPARVGHGRGGLVSQHQSGLRGTLQRLVGARYSWAVLAILVLLVVNLVRDPSYLAISVNPVTGNLAGNVLDILRAAAPILMIAVGMCLVISTSGIDLSVGSVMAVSGAVSMELLRNLRSEEHTSELQSRENLVCR